MRNTELRTSALINWARPGSVADMAAHRQTQPLSNTGTALLEQMIKKKPGRQSEPQLLPLRLILTSRGPQPLRQSRSSHRPQPLNQTHRPQSRSSESEPQLAEPQLILLLGSSPSGSSPFLLLQVAEAGWHVLTDNPAAQHKTLLTNAHSA